MTNDELKKMIAQIITNHLCPNKKSHFSLYGNSADCYNRDNFAECMPICDTVDALIAAGIGDAKAAEHRAEVAERALERTVFELLQAWGYSALMAVIRAEEFFIPEAIKEAEKELLEEKQK